MITIEASAQERRQAKAPHELFTVNVMVIHLFFTLGLIKLLSVDMNLAVMSTIALSCLIIIYTFFRTKKAKQNDPYLVYIHWQLSLNRYKMMIVAYVIYFIGLAVGSVLSTGANVGMDGTSIVEAITMRLSIIPLFVVILVGSVIGSGSMFNAGRGEIDEKMTKKYPQ